MEHYIVELINDAQEVNCQEGDGYVLDMKVYDMNDNFIMEMPQAPYVDEKQIYKNYLKAGTKWEMTCINGIKKLKPLEPK
jgi:hypothetical protein